MLKILLELSSKTPIKLRGQSAVLKKLSADDRLLLKELNKKKKSIVIIKRDHSNTQKTKLLLDQLNESKEQFQKLGRAHHDLSIAYKELLNSRSWRITYPIRLIGQIVRNELGWLTRLYKFSKNKGGPVSLVFKAFTILKNEGPQALFFRVSSVLSIDKEGANRSEEYDRNDYSQWIKKYDSLTDIQRNKFRDLLLRWKEPPLISIIMPTYNSPIEFLRLAIESVEKQIYPHWELCIADDFSSDIKVLELLKEKSGQDSRIKVFFRKENGHICAASNSALELASGAWSALLDHDDLLSEDALFYVARHIIAHPEARIIYTDEDKINERGERFCPHFKSDWNPELFFTQNYISHLGVYKTELLRSIDGFRVGLEGSQDHDLVLRCLPHLAKDSIHHIPKVLYHWRAISGSTSLDDSSKPYADGARIKALKDYFDSRGLNVSLEKGLIPNTVRVKYPIPEPEPLVSLLIPTRDRLNLIEPCVRSILEKTIYKHFEIIILDNASNESETLAFFDAIQKEDDRVRVLRDERPFNFSAINNLGVSCSKGSIVGLINNDIEVISPEWLGEMVSYCVQDDIGCVGAKLFYSNDTMQHGGVILGIGGVANHSHYKFPRYHSGYFGRLNVAQSLSAVTAACLLVRKDVFLKVGGLNEQDLKIAFNDVDFCLKVRTQGYRNVWTPYSELYHYESLSRGTEDTPEKKARFSKEIEYLIKSWGPELIHDPFYNPNLTIDAEDFSLAWGPRQHPYTLL